jgi:hypothetical protein
VIGQNATLRCHTTSSQPVDWIWKNSNDSYQADNYIYNNWKIQPPYLQRFAIARTQTGDYNLIITNVQLSHSGLYMCVEDSGYGARHHIMLTVHAELDSAADAVASELQTDLTSSTTAWTTMETPVTGSSAIIIAACSVIVVVIVVVILFLCRRRPTVYLKVQQLAAVIHHHSRGLQHRVEKCQKMTSAGEFNMDGNARLSSVRHGSSSSSSSSSSTEKLLSHTNHLAVPTAVAVKAGQLGSTRLGVPVTREKRQWL